jgi:tyrosinase
MGVHIASHFVLGGDPGGDFAASPGKPYLFFHHASIDRFYRIWQNLKPAERTKALYGGTVISDLSVPAMLQDELQMGAVCPGSITIEDASSTMGGPVLLHIHLGVVYSWNVVGIYCVYRLEI